MTDLFELAQAVKRGVKLLDRKIPRWRTVLRKHADEFDFASGDHCVLGTLEAHSARMKMLIRKKGCSRKYTTFGRAVLALDLGGGADEKHGFDVPDSTVLEEQEQYRTLGALWRAEFLKPEE